MPDSTGDPQWTIFGVKLKPSAIAENIAASLVIAFAGFILLDLFTAFSNQLARIMPAPGGATANVIDFTKIAIAMIFTGAFAYHLNRLGLWTANDAAFAALRTRLTASETAGAWYRRAMRGAIFLTDRFVGDAGKARKSWRSNAFGLKKAAPLWTAASYDRCLLIALVYPVLCIYAIWAVTGKAGDAGTVLGLVDGTDIAHIVRVLLILGMVCGFTMFVRIIVWKKWLWLAVAATIVVCSTFVFAFADALAGAYLTVFVVCGTISGAYVVNLVIADAFDEVYAITGTISISLAVTYAVVEAGSGAGASPNYVNVFSVVAMAAAFAIASAVVGGLGYLRSRVDWHSFDCFFSAFVLALCLFMPLASVAIFNWQRIGGILYFLPLLTLINAPFDWLALGITRGLLRKGLEKGGLWPLGLGVIDLLISLFIVALLGVAVLIVTQIFNATTVVGGADKLVFDPLPALHDLATPGLRNQPQYYWLYLMLLTTQIPAILSLGAGFLSVIRTGDFGNMLVLRLMGGGQGVGLWTRGALAAVQALQFALAMTAGGLLFYLLFIGFVTVEPFAAGNLIDLLLWIAEANWPARLLGVAG